MTVAAMTDHTLDSAGVALPDLAGSLRTDTCVSPLSSCTGAADPGDAVGVTPAGGAKASVCDHRVAVSFGRHNQDVQPKAETLSLEELDARFNVPDTKRGQLSRPSTTRWTSMTRRKRRSAAGRKTASTSCLPTSVVMAVELQTMSSSCRGSFSILTPGRTVRSTIETKLEGISYLAYTSYSHRPDDQRWRVFVPYASPIERSKHEAVFEHFNALFENDLDVSCKKPGQIYYTPACPADARHEYDQWFADGALFDPTKILERGAAKDDAAPGGG